LPGGTLPWPEGRSGALLLAVLTVAGVTLSLRRSWLVLGLGLAAVACWLTGPGLVAALTPNRGWPPPNWAIVQCDVDQGSSTLIRSGPDRAVIVDTGPDDGLVDRCLRRAGVAGLDLVVLTHFHADHAGGLRGAVRGRGSPPILVSPLTEPDDQVRAVVATAAAAGLAIVTAIPGMTGHTGTGDWPVRWRLLSPVTTGPVERPGLPWPPGGLATSGRSAGPGAGGTGRVAEAVGSPAWNDDAAGGTEINNSSVAVFAEVQGVRVMVLGDVEPEAQRPLIQTILGASADAGVAAGAGNDAVGRPESAEAPAGSALAPVDVVVVAHHGSARQVPRLYELLRPRVALIGVGADNDYGHPAPSAMALLRRVGALSLRTDQQGQLAICGPPGDLRAVTSK
jgi:competence protein ComEC